MCLFSSNENQKESKGLQLILRHWLSWVLTELRIPTEWLRNMDYKHTSLVFLAFKQLQKKQITVELVDNLLANWLLQLS